MISKVQKWGNSQGVRIPKSLLRSCDIDIGDELEILADGKELTIKPVSNIRGKYNLRDLVSKIPNNYKPNEEDWGAPQGKEEW